MTKEESCRSTQANLKSFTTRPKSDSKHGLAGNSRNSISKLDYLEDGTTIVMTHVGVHPELRGHGVAGKLTEVALGYARGKSLRVIPMCSYVAAYIRRNPQHAELTKQRV